MRYDDRLLTVLSQPVGDRHDAAVRWRQLVDLVARAGRDGASGTIGQALDTIRSESPQIDEEVRAAAARAVAGRPLPMGLLEYFISDRLAVSAPVLAAASLDPVQWDALLSSADDETRRFVETLHPEVTSAPSRTPVSPDSESLEPAIEALAAAVNGAEPARPNTRQPGPSLSEVVARIERRRRSRDARRVAVSATVPDEPPSLFRWECGPGGDIAWVEGAPRGALIGRSIARVQNGDADRVDDEVVRAFAMRAPFRDAEMRVGGEGLVAGTWKISGLPAFEPTDGRFAGYRGIALRETEPPARRQEAPDVLSDPDSLRELVHEVKTPLNAIIGFAEIIQGQYLGPADHRYRSRAGEIVTQARLLLGAIDDLDFAAKIHSSSGTQRHVDMRELVERAGEALGQTASERNVELELGGAAVCFAAIEPEIANRLMTRFAAAVLDRATAGDHLRLSVERDGDHCRISITRPAALRDLTETDVFGETGQDTFAGFTLRLVRGLARIAGGDLLVSPTSLSLVFPSA